MVVWYVGETGGNCKKKINNSDYLKYTSHLLIQETDIGALINNATDIFSLISKTNIK